MKITSRRLPALLAAAALPLALLGFAPSANAAVPVFGPLKVTPGTGSSTSLLQFDTLPNQACPALTDSIQVLVTGQTLTDDQPGIINGNTTYSQALGDSNNISVPAGRTLDLMFQEVGVSAPSGLYTIRLQCLDTSLQITGEFRIDTHWTPTSGAGNGTFIADSTATTTTTALTAGTPDPVASGTGTTLTATVSPSDAAGTVQFKNGAANLGAPVAVSGGVATSGSTILPAGTNSLSAVFTPTDANAFKASTGTRSYAVAGPTTISGTARVGSALSCNASTGGTLTYSWLKNGVATGVATKTVVVPAAWYNTTISCALTSTKAPTAVTRTSTGVKIALGLAPVAKVKPSVRGILKVGKILTCAPGTWSPVPSSYKYQWFRGARKIAGKVAKTYRTVATDRNKLITCQVTTVKAGYAAGVAKAPAKKVT